VKPAQAGQIDTRFSEAEVPADRLGGRRGSARACAALLDHDGARRRPPARDPADRRAARRRHAFQHRRARAEVPQPRGQSQRRAHDQAKRVGPGRPCRGGERRAGRRAPAPTGARRRGRGEVREHLAQRRPRRRGASSRSAASTPCSGSRRSRSSPSPRTHSRRPPSASDRLRVVWLVRSRTAEPASARYPRAAAGSGPWASSGGAPGRRRLPQTSAPMAKMAAAHQNAVVYPSTAACCSTSAPGTRPDR
jgi:hypothetical protein